MTNELWGKMYHEVVKCGIWAKLVPIEKAVYPVLVSYAHIYTGVCMPTQETIAKKSGIHLKNVRRAIKGSEKNRGLEKWKLIKTWMSSKASERFKRRLHYKILDPKTGIVPQSMAIYPPKKRRIARTRDLKGRFVGSTAINYGIHSAIKDGSGSAINYGYKKEILKRNTKKIQTTNILDTLFSLFENEHKGQITRAEIEKTLLANWGEDPWIAEQRAKESISSAVNSSATWWQYLMGEKTEISIETLN